MLNKNLSVALLSGSLTVTHAYAAPCATNGGKDPSNLLVPLVLNSVMPPIALNDSQEQQVAKYLRQTYGSNVNSGGTVNIIVTGTSQYGTGTRAYHYSINNYAGQTTIARAFELKNLSKPPANWDKCNPRENPRYQACCQECAEQGMAEWELVADAFNRGYITHQEEIEARSNQTIHLAA